MDFKDIKIKEKIKPDFDKLNNSFFNFLGKNKSNWEKLSTQDVTDTVKYRDVYSDQQLDRTKISAKKSFTSRFVLSIVIGILAGILMWCVISFVSSSCIHLRLK